MTSQRDTTAPDGSVNGSVNPSADPTLEAALGRIFADMAPASACPRPDELAAWVAGELSDTEGELLLARVADHPAAMETLLALRASSATASSAGSSAASAAVSAPREAGPDVQAGIAATLARLSFPAPSLEVTPGTVASVSQPPVAGTFAGRRTTPPAHWAWASLAAAALLLLGLGSAFWVQRQSYQKLAVELATTQAALAASQEQTRDLDDQIAALSVPPAPPTPASDIRILDLFPAGRLRSSLGENTAQLDRADQNLVLILTPSDPVPQRGYQLRLTVGDTVRWHAEVRADAAGVVVVLLPRLFLAPGSYQITLQPRESQAVDRFDFALAPQP